MATNDPLVYVLILNWNGWANTVECVSALRQVITGRCRVVVIDNGSTDGSVARLQDWAAGVGEDAPLTVVTYDQATAERGGAPTDEARLMELAAAQGLVLIEATANWGFAEGNNIGIRYALAQGADYVFLLNNDARPTAGLLDQLVCAAQAADAGIVGARVFDESGAQELYAGRRWPGQIFSRGRDLPHDPARSYWPSSDAEGSGILLRRDLLAQRRAECGYFLDPRFFMYWEDVDLCQYGLDRGYACVIARDAVIYHGQAQSSGGRGNPRSYYYMTRNRIDIANRWLSWPWKVLFHLYYIPSRVALQLLRPRTRQAGRVRAAVFAGLIDGYCQVRGKWQNHGA